MFRCINTWAFSFYTPALLLYPYGVPCSCRPLWGLWAAGSGYMAALACHVVLTPS